MLLNSVLCIAARRRDVRTGPTHDGVGPSVRECSMTEVLRAHFDGSVIVPDEPVDLPVNEPSLTAYLLTLATATWSSRSGWRSIVPCILKLMEPLYRNTARGASGRGKGWLHGGSGTCRTAKPTLGSLELDTGAGESGREHASREVMRGAERFPRRELGSRRRVWCLFDGRLLGEVAFYDLA